MISIIIPVYNTEAYLDKCIESVTAQTYTDIEIILVDDGSPDNCPAICDVWAAKDSRIKVIHKPNGGLSDARNAGMAIAQGEYIGFVDSDDWIEPQMYELLLDTLQSSQADIVECAIDKFSANKPPFINANLEHKVTAYSTVEALKELILERDLHQMACNKLYNANIAKQIQFENGKICEDEFWTYQIFGIAQRIFKINIPLYHYLQREGSIIHTYSPKRLACITAFEQRKDYMKINYPELYFLASRSYLNGCLFHSQMLLFHHNVDPDGSLRKQLHQRFKAGDYKELIASANFKYKIWYSMFLYCPALTCRLRNLFKIGF